MTAFIKEKFRVILGLLVDETKNTLKLSSGNHFVKPVEVLIKKFLLFQNNFSDLHTHLAIMLCRPTTISSAAVPA
tara:strand:+ start:103 stop:327 length:225 start_codon:yes stop_codon:yes gene_type:complete